MAKVSNLAAEAFGWTLLALRLMSHIWDISFQLYLYLPMRVYRAGRHRKGWPSGGADDGKSLKLGS